MTRDLDMADVLDREDVVMLDGEPCVSMTGLLKLAAASSFHNGSADGRERSERVMDAFLSAAQAKGWRKADLFRSAFAKQYPPTPSARALAKEVVALFSNGELRQLFEKPEGTT